MFPRPACGERARERGQCRDDQRPEGWTAKSAPFLLSIYRIPNSNATSLLSFAPVAQLDGARVS